MDFLNKTNSPSYFCGKGVFADRDHLYLFGQSLTQSGSRHIIDKSHNGTYFESWNENLVISDKTGKYLDLDKTENFRISRNGDKYLLVFTYAGEEQGLYIAQSEDLVKWEKAEKLGRIPETAMVVGDFKYKNQYVIYSGGKSLKVAYSSNLVKWKITGDNLLPSDPNKKTKISIAAVIAKKEGIVIFYFLGSAINAAIFDRNNPQKALQISLFDIFKGFNQKENNNFKSLGLVEFKGKLISFWQEEKGGIYAVTHFPGGLLSDDLTSEKKLRLKKEPNNPIITPRQEHYWESRATFNPAAIYEDGRIHLVYRAIGDQDISVLGYASSRDGINFDKREDKPIYVPDQPYEITGNFGQAYNSPYMSGGGGFGGCEDPRLTKIGDKIYMTYVAYNGWEPPRIALTSIKTKDFLSRKWNWEKSVLISPPGVVDKNACLLPEKINGKFVVFHRIFPDILIDFVDNLDFESGNFLKGEFHITPRKLSWDSRKVGVGAPPVKTPDGWLLIYHAVGNDDAGRYKMGAMLLDLNDPTKVLIRTLKPILEPTEIYENVGFKSGVAYPCGAVIIGDKLIVYYGGADMVVCAATADVNHFLKELKNTGSSSLRQIQGEPLLFN